MMSTIGKQKISEDLHPDLTQYLAHFITDHEVGETVCLSGVPVYEDLKNDRTISKKVSSLSFDVGVCFQSLGDIVSPGFALTSLPGDSETSTPPPGVANVYTGAQVQGHLDFFLPCFPLHIHSPRLVGSAPWVFK